MIAQLKISENKLKHRVFRTIEVDHESSFSELDEMIAISFDHLHLSSYLFEIKKSNGKPHLHTYIGTDFENAFTIEEALILDEEANFLNEWLPVVGDFTHYHMADGSYEFLIEVTAVGTEVFDQNYPVCVAGKGNLNINYNTPVNLDDISLCMQLMAPLDEEFGHAVIDLPDWTGLLNDAEMLKKLKPWDYFSENEIIAIEVPKTKELLFASVLGGAGEEFGITIYKGNKGHELVMKKMANQLSEDFYFHIDSLNISFVDRDVLEQDDYELIKDAGYSFSGKNQWIQFRSFDSGLFPNLPDADGVEKILLVIQQVTGLVSARINGWVYPVLPPNFYVFRQMNTRKYQWEQSILEIPIQIAEKDILYIEISQFELKQLHKKKKSLVHIEFDLIYLPHAVKKEGFERPFYPAMVVGIDCTSGMLLFQEVLPMPKDPYVAQLLFTAFLQAIDFQPASVFVTQEVANWIDVIANLSQIKLTVVSKLSEVELFKDYICGQTF